MVANGPRLALVMEVLPSIPKINPPLKVVVGTE